MIDIISTYETHCMREEIPFHRNKSVLSYDDTTLFCPAGMQRFKSCFRDEAIVGTTANIQPCIRLNDLELLGDGIHLAYFNMIGLFSFRQYSVNWTIGFFHQFIRTLGLTLNKVTIHPDRVDDNQWTGIYKEKGLNIVVDPECKWSDGEIGGYCTEFYVNDIEIGNIVNPLGNCIDVGFGLERLDQLVNGTKPKTRVQELIDTAMLIIDNGIAPGANGRPYVLRKLIREIIKAGGEVGHVYFHEEAKRQQTVQDRYLRLKDKYEDKSKEWWFDTHGVDITLI